VKRSLPVPAQKPVEVIRSLPRSTQLAFALAVLMVLGPATAGAYPWMIRHHYASCSSCHADPSGGGVLTQYGRAQADLLVPSFGAGRDAEEPSQTFTFFLGKASTPEWLDLAFSFRGGALVNRAGSTTAVRPIQMATDLRAHARFGLVRVAASVGFALRRALPASITPWPENNIASREHWVGFDAAEQSVLIRAGRIPIPFGLRTPEHTTWVRERTRTDTNDDQQHGVAIALNVEGLRAELMGILGNLQLRPSEYRERGFAGFVEKQLGPEIAVGLSSQVMQSRMDVETREAFFLRQAHGAFARWAPVEPVAVLAELDLLATRSGPGETIYGHAAMVQADWEALRGLHLIATGESLSDRGVSGVGGWGSVAWFLTHYAELRVDAIVRRIDSGTTPAATFTSIAQVHLTL
jgi:hypothetical protein